MKKIRLMGLAGTDSQRRDDVPPWLYERVRILREQLDNSEVFHETFSTFFNLLGAEGMARLGRRVQQPLLDGVLRQLGAELSGDPAEQVRLRMVRVNAFGLTHGSVMTQSLLLSFFYFSDLERGMCCFIQGDRPGTGYLRFTLARLPSPHSLLCN